MSSKTFRKGHRQSRLIGAAVILILAILGTVYIFNSHAASPYAAVNANTGTVVSPATVQSSSGATDGKYVQFGTASNGKCSTTVSGSQVISLDSGAYHLQGDEWDSSEPFSLCNDGGVDFSIATSEIDNTGGAPGAYPSLYKGCHWGDCTTSSGLPVLVSTMTGTPNTVTTSYNTTTVSGTWDDSYDIWFNSASSTSNNQSGLELMIWLNHMGGVQPIGSVVASNVSVDGYSFDVWHGGSGAGTVSYVMTSPATSVSNLDLGPFAADAVSRGYMTSSWYLIDVEAGFETWVGGAGLTANSFSVNVQ